MQGFNQKGFRQKTIFFFFYILQWAGKETQSVARKGASDVVFKLVSLSPPYSSAEPSVLTYRVAEWVTSNSRRSHLFPSPKRLSSASPKGEKTEKRRRTDCPSIRSLASLVNPLILFGCYINLSTFHSKIVMLITITMTDRQYISIFFPRCNYT